MQVKQRYWDMVMAGIYGLRDKSYAGETEVLGYGHGWDRCICS